jgi:hypothetical protein
METASTQAPESQPRQRRVLVSILIVFASILALLSVFAIWANRQLLETDNWVETSSELLEDEAIRTELANFITDEVFTTVDVQNRLEKTLPPNLQGLASPASAGLRQLTDELADEALQRPRVQQGWETINRAAHQKLLQVVEADTGEPVTLDMSTIVEEVGSQAGINVADKLPPGAGQIEVIPADDLEAAREIVNLLEKLAIWLTVLALLLFALAIYLARGWRREALRTIGFAFIIVGALVSVLRALAGDYLVDTLASTASVEPAINNAWDISTSLLGAGGGAMVFYGIVIVLGAWIAGPGSVATSVRRAITPVMEQRTIGYAALLLVLLVLFWWAPTEGFSRLPTAILIIALLVIGFEFLRHQAVKEFPDETWERGSERWRNAGRGLLDRGRSMAGGGDRDSGPGGGSA